MKRRFFDLFLRVALALLAIAVVLGFAVVLFPQEALTVDSGDVEGDVVVVLGGGSDEERAERAAELFKAGKAPLVLISGTGDFDLTLKELKKFGVPVTRIKIEDKSTTTFENAKFSVALLREMGARRVIIVTTWYHSRRALACFEHVAPDMTFYSRPSYFAYSKEEWGRGNMREHIRAEFLKVPAYVVLHGVFPF